MGSREYLARGVRSAVLVVVLFGALPVVLSAMQAAPAAANGGTPTIVNNADVAWNSGMSRGSDYGLECTDGEGCSINGTDGAGTNGGGAKQWLESINLSSRASGQGGSNAGSSEIRVSVLVKHDADDSVRYVYLDRDWNGTDESNTVGNRFDLTSLPAGTSATVKRAAGSQYSLVFLRTTSWSEPSTWGTTAGGSGDGNRAAKTLRMRVGTTGGGTSAVSTSTQFIIKAYSDGNDWPAMFDQPRVNSPGYRNSSNTLLNGTATSTTLGGSSVEYRTNGDDPDSSGCDYFDALDFRWRRISDGRVEDPTDTGGEGQAGWNSYSADNNSSNNHVVVPNPSQPGRWVMEAVLMNESDCNTYRNPDANFGLDDVPNRGWWQWIGTIDVNPTTVPSVSSLTASAATVVSGQPLTLTANYTGTGDGDTFGALQYFKWDSNADGSNETMVEATNIVNGAPTNTLAASTSLPPGVKTYSVIAGDNGVTVADGTNERTVTRTVAVTIVNPTTTAVSCTTPINRAGSSGTTTSTCTATVTDTGSFGTASLGGQPVNFTATAAGGGGTYTLASCNLPDNPAGPVKVCTASFSSPYQAAWTIRGAYAGDSAHAASAQSAGTVVNVRNAATPTVACTPDPQLYSASGTCTATVTDSTTGANTRVTTPTGGVQLTGAAPASFSNGGACTLSQVSSSVASCSVSYVNPQRGVPSITVTYAGSDDHFASSTGSGTTHIRNTSSTSVVCPPTSPAPSYDQAGSCTVTVTDTASGPNTAVGTPTGAVTLSGAGDGTATFSPCSLTQASVGVATCTVSVTVTVQDTYAITASKVGDNDHAGSTSAPVNLSFRNHNTSSSVVCSPTSVVAGTPTTCTVTVTDTQPGVTKSAPLGTVTFGQSGGGSFSATTCGLVAATSSSSTCSQTYSPTFGGAHTVTASFNGATSGAAAGGFKHRSSSAVPVPVTATGSTGQHPTSTSVSCSPNPVQVSTATTCTAIVTDTMTFAAKATPTGTVNFAYSGGGTLSPTSCTLAVNVVNVSAKCSVTFTPNGIAGSKTVQANYAGVPVKFKASGSGSIFVTATAAPVTPPPAQVQHPTSTSVSCSPSTLPLGNASTCTVTVTDTYSGTKSSPAGSVSFGSSGGGTLSAPTCTLQASGNGVTSTCHVTFTPTGAKGSKTVIASYAGTPQVHKASGSGSFYLTAT